MRREIAKGYLAAMIDGEGSVAVHPHTKHRWVVIYNTEKALIDVCLEACKTLGLKPKVVLRPSVSRLTPKPGSTFKPIWRLYFFGRENLERLALLPISHPRKRMLLTLAISSIHRPRRPTAEWLQKRLDEGMTPREIAQRLGVATNTIPFWCRQLGVPTRNLKEAWVIRRRRRSDTSLKAV